MTQKILHINGKPMPFTAEELRIVLKTMRKSIFKAGEEICDEDKEEILNHLLEELEEA